MKIRYTLYNGGFTINTNEILESIEVNTKGNNLLEAIKQRHFNKLYKKYMPSNFKSYYYRLIGPVNDGSIWIDFGSHSKFIKAEEVK